MISIQVQYNLKQIGKKGIDIRCLVNDSENESIDLIQLIRTNTNIVSVSEEGVFWQDTEVEKRAIADGSVNYSASSYLHMAIDKESVTKNDGGTYFCVLSAKYRIPEKTQKTFLNITGNCISKLS